MSLHRNPLLLCKPYERGVGIPSLRELVVSCAGHQEAVLEKGARGVRESKSARRKAGHRGRV